MKAIIFAAGLGTRLKPITDTLPKAMVNVCGQPLLFHVIMKLKNAGVTEIVVNVHHFADMITDWLDENGRFGIDIRVSDERDLLRETGGGILHAEPLIGNGDFFVHNVDIISNLDLNWFKSQVRPESLATLLVSDRKTQRYLLFNGDMRLVGWTNLATGEVKSPFPDLKINECRMFAFAGIHYISENIFKAMRELGFEGRFPIMDLYLRACKDYQIQGAVPKDLKLIDVGKLDSLAAAEEALTSFGL